MKPFIVGGKGQLGRELSLIFTQNGYTFREADLPELDITRAADTAAAIQSFGADVVINASAYTQVDKAESERDLAFRVNATGPDNLAAICADLGIPLIHVSTDYVFDGNKGSAYVETDPVKPIGVYGESKEAGEHAVRQRLNRHLIFRTSWLYSIHGQNFMKTMLRIGKERGTIRVVEDQYGCPTTARDLAAAIVQAMKYMEKGENIPWGTYHYCNAGIISWYEFSVKIFEIAKKYDSFKVQRVEAIPTSEYPTAARRPAFSALNCEKIEKASGIRLIPWEKSLAETIEEWYRLQGNTKTP